MTAYYTDNAGSTAYTATGNNEYWPSYTDNAGSTNYTATGNNEYWPSYIDDDDYYYCDSKDVKNG